MLIAWEFSIMSKNRMGSSLRCGRLITRLESVDFQFLPLDAPDTADLLLHIVQDLSQLCLVVRVGAVQLSVGQDVEQAAHLTTAAAATHLQRRRIQPLRGRLEGKSIG